MLLDFFWTAQGHIGWIGRHLQKWTQSCVIFQSHFVCFWFLFLLFFCFLLRLCNMRLNTDDDVKSYNSWCCKIQCTVVFFGLFFFHPLNDCLQSYKVLHALFKTARQNCIASNRRRSSLSTSVAQIRVGHENVWHTPENYTLQIMTFTGRHKSRLTRQKLLLPPTHESCESACSEFTNEKHKRTFR